MRIAYGVHGYGRGHAMRTSAVLPDLARRHELRIFAGGNAIELLSRRYLVERVPHLEYRYRGQTISWPLTLAANAKLAWNLLAGGPALRSVVDRLSEFRPDVVVSDSEPFVLAAAAKLGVPRIGFDHVGIIAHCRARAPGLDGIRLALDGAAYRLLLGRPERVVVSSFYDLPTRGPGIHRVGCVLRPEVLAARPTPGSHLLVYFNQSRLYGLRVERALRELGLPARVYGSGRNGPEGPIDHRPFDERTFVEDLASCRAVLATAGHQLISEAIHLGKPILLVPEDTAEQRLNARAAAEMGVGRWIRPGALTAATVRAFLANLQRHQAALARAGRAGDAGALELLHCLARELAVLHRPSLTVASRPCW